MIRWLIGIDDSTSQRDWFIVFIQNVGFDDSIYVVLSSIRAISCFGFLFVLFSYVEFASTCSRNIWFLVNFSCRVDNKIFLFFTMTKNCLTSALLLQHLW